MNLLSKDFSNFIKLKAMSMTTTFVANVVIVTSILVLVAIIRDLSKNN